MTAELAWHLQLVVLFLLHDQLVHRRSLRHKGTPADVNCLSDFVLRRILLLQFSIKWFIILFRSLFHRSPPHQLTSNITVLKRCLACEDAAADLVILSIFKAPSPSHDGCPIAPEQRNGLSFSVWNPLDAVSHMCMVPLTVEVLTGCVHDRQPSYPGQPVRHHISSGAEIVYYFYYSFVVSLIITIRSLVHHGPVQLSILLMPCSTAGADVAVEMGVIPQSDPTVLADAGRSTLLIGMECGRKMPNWEFSGTGAAGRVVMRDQLVPFRLLPGAKADVKDPA